MGLSIIVLSNREAEKAVVCVESVRRFCDMDDTDLILVSNGEDTTLDQWAAGQKDLTYVQMDPEGEKDGSTLNQVVEQLVKKEAFMVLKPYMLLLPPTISQMYQLLTKASSIAAVGPLYNGVLFKQQRAEEPIYQAEDAMAYNQKLQKMPGGEMDVMQLAPGAVMFCMSFWKQLGGFDDRLTHWENVLTDYSLRLLEKGGRSVVCRNVLLFCAGENEENLLTGEDLSVLEKKWGMHYFNLDGNDAILYMLNLPKDSQADILEIGCDLGATLFMIHERFPGTRVHGCELNPAAAAAASRYMDVIEGNIELKSLPYEKESMDYIIFGDVLEHLRDPLGTLVYVRDYLKPGGCVIASIPNLMHISVIKELLNGDFTYTEHGLLDKTHIHLFTYKEIVKMFEAADYQMVDWAGTQIPISAQDRELIKKLLQMGKDVERYMYETFQYVVVFRKNGTGKEK